MIRRAHVTRSMGVILHDNGVNHADGTLLLTVFVLFVVLGCF